MVDLIGQSFGRYHIVEKLGEGGMAIVYKAFDTHLECEVAVKVIRTDQLAPAVLDRTMKRFEREAKEVARLNHPNIVRVMDYGEHDGIPFLVMPYLHGGTLKQLLGSPMPWQQAVSIIEPIARALDYAHQHRMIHRDVKPSNILITDSGEMMLTDFGIVKMLDVEEGNTLTGTGMGLGTPEYMAPEQWVGEFTPAVDQYSLGVVFYELVTGRKPYTADTPAAVLLKQANEPLPRPRTYAPALPEEVENLLFKMLAKNPADRFKSMDELAARLKRLANLGDTEKNHPENASNKIETLTAVKEYETTDEVKPEKVVPPEPSQVLVPHGNTIPGRGIKVIIGAVLGGSILLVILLGFLNGWFKLASPVVTVQETDSSQPQTTPKLSTEVPTKMTETPSPSVTSSLPEPYYYVVQESDTCFDIAVNHGVDLLLLQSINNFPDGECPIMPGMAVVIPAPGQVLPTIMPVDPDLPSGTKVRYTVQRGDTFASIAAFFRSSVDAILTLNNITDGNSLYIGQSILVPVNLVTATPDFVFNTATPTSTVGQNSTSIKNSEFDGMPMVYVPAGVFLMGSPDNEYNAAEQPQHTVFLDSYWIDQTEITNAMYAACVTAGVCSAPTFNSSQSRDSYFLDPQYVNYPVMFVSWQQANTYCEWVGRKLPTEAQWEKAARGTDGRIYPWGSQEPDSTLVNFDNNNGDTEAVGSHPEGASPYGAQDMAGNVWEWVEDWFGDYNADYQTNPTGAADGELRVVRGGAWTSNADNIRTAYRYRSLFSSINIGFRCAMDEN